MQIDPPWREKILSFQSLLEGQQYRHGIGAIPASSIGTQFFCEMKVEQEYTHEEVETEDKAEGAALHEQLLPMQQSTRGRLLDDIERKRLVVASFALAAKAKDLILVGVPDAVIFQSGSPTHVVELKTTKGDPLILFDGQRAQTLIYGLLLNQVGFDCKGLQLVVVKFRRQASLSDGQKNDFLSRLTKDLVSGSNPKSMRADSRGQIVAHAFAYSRDEALQILGRTEDYWLMQRDAIPSTNPNKCRACEFREVCPSSLARTNVRPA